MHRQHQEPSLYSSAAPKGACKPHSSHIDRFGVCLTQYDKNGQPGPVFSSVVRPIIGLCRTALSRLTQYDKTVNPVQFLVRPPGLL